MLVVLVHGFLELVVAGQVGVGVVLVVVVLVLSRPLELGVFAGGRVDLGLRVEFSASHSCNCTALRVKVEARGKEFDLAGVYAPAVPMGRVSMFGGLGNRLSVDTIVGGNWNCVPDVTLPGCEE